MCLPVSFSPGYFSILERPALLFLLFPLIVLQVSRARAGARVLEEKFGEEYRARTWF